MPPPPPFPRISSGIIRQVLDETDTEGRPSLQGRVAYRRRVDRLDEFLRPGWKIVSRHQISKDIFNARQQKLIDILEFEFAHVSRGAQLDSDSYCDIDGDYDSWFEINGRLSSNVQITMCSVQQRLFKIYRTLLMSLASVWKRVGGKGFRTALLNIR
jgi:hypothetical protein